MYSNLHDNYSLKNEYPFEYSIEFFKHCSQIEIEYSFKKCEYSKAKNLNSINQKMYSKTFE